MRLYIYRKDEGTEDRELFRSFENVSKGDSIKLYGMASNTPYYAVITDDENIPLEHTTTMEGTRYDDDLFLTLQADNSTAGTFKEGYRILLVDDASYFKLLFDEEEVDIQEDETYRFDLYTSDKFESKFGQPYVNNVPYKDIIEHLKNLEPEMFYYIVAKRSKEGTGEIAYSEIKQKV